MNLQKKRIKNLNDRFRRVLEDNTDELDFCRELIEEGITDEDIREAAGETCAHWFCRFCDSHGLRI